MFKLIQNENLKIYRRMRTWIMLGILVLAIILIAVVLVTDQPASTGAWKQALAAQTAQLQTQLQHARHMPAQAIQQIKAQIQLNQYELKHNINPLRTTGWGFAAEAQGAATLLIAFILVVAGDIVASEFSTGTIKMLLTQPATRGRILTAKYLAMLIFG
ncbi:MAG: ABC transporter permease, partial [Alicyclobacillus sp.]|nr:ABC transporter permease [Alicyclobacillus sp.]